MRVMNTHKCKQRLIAVLNRRQHSVLRLFGQRPIRTSTRCAALGEVEGISDDKVVILKKGKANLFRKGNPIVYGGAVEHTTGDIVTGDAVLVTDDKSKMIGWGFFNSSSMYR